MLQRAYVEITNVCNLRCSFCPGTRREKKFIDPAEFRVLAEKLRLWTDYLYLHVMGEPLLHPTLGEILDECDRLGFRVCVTTNGVLLPSRLAVLRGRRCLHKVSVSLHSFEGNGGDGGLEEYVTGCWESCRALAAEGVICALRLWNERGADRLNGRVLDALSRLTERLFFSIVCPCGIFNTRRLLALNHCTSTSIFFPGIEALMPVPVR